jgi:hypothetical protein
MLVTNQITKEFLKMKNHIIKLIFGALLAIASPAFSQVNVQKASGTNLISGDLTFGSGKSLTMLSGSTFSAVNPIFTGIGSFASGTNTAPSITFTADTNTGLYLDAANVLGVATNGSGTVLFSSSAGVGKIKAHGTRVLALEAGTGNTNITLTPSGTGVVSVTGALTASTTVADAGGTIAAQRNGLAPAQGLVFDGTAGSTIGGSVIVGTGDYTLVLKLNATTIATSPALLDSSGGQRFQIYIQSTGEIRHYDGTTVTDIAPAGTFTPYVGLPTHLTITRASGLLKYSINGAALSAGVANTTNQSTALNILGSNSGNNLMFNGTLRLLAIENRALSAAEVLALYQSGAVASGDFNLVTNDSGTAVGASNTSLVTGANSTFASNSGWWTLGGGTPPTISGGVANFTNGSSVLQRDNFLKIGSRYTLTVGTITGGGFYFNGGVPATSLTAGVPVTFTATQVLIQFFTGGGAGTIDNVTIVPIGALVAPEPQALGSGLVWRDVSGNAANITLPASGVSWALPWSGYVTGPTTTDLTLAGGSSGATLTLGQGTSGVGTLSTTSENVLNLTSSYSTASSNRILRLISSAASVTNSGMTIESASANDASRNWGFVTNNSAFGDCAIMQSNALAGNPLTAGTAALYLSAARNVLIGTTTDSGAKLQVNGSATFAGAVRMSNYGAGAATFDSSGNITSVSDARLKNITGTFTKGLAEIVKLTPKLYTWKPETGLVTDDINATLIAQDLIAAGIPEAVTTYRTVAVMENDVQSAEDLAAGKPVTQHAKLDSAGKPVTQRVDANYSVSDRTVIAALVNAVKELKAEIDALKAAK